jgi:hypothetical protein
MIRFLVALTNDRTVEVFVNKQPTQQIIPARTIMRKGVCGDKTFNMQALAPDEVAVELTAEQWMAVNDAMHLIDLSGDEPVLIPKPE